jgi:hypothetical protein
MINGIFPVAVLPSPGLTLRSSTPALEAVPEQSGATVWRVEIAICQLLEIL